MEWAETVVQLERKESLCDRPRPASRPGRLSRRCIAKCAPLLATVLLAALAGSATGQAPNIQGLWEIEYKFVEMKGDKNYMNACKGPFPYSYKWNFDICQSPGKNDFTATITGADAGTARSQTIVEGTPDNVIQRCAYRRTTQGPAGETQDWLAKGAPGYPEDTLWQTYKPKDEAGFSTEPRTFRNFHLPITKPYLWGQICFQYDWQDTQANQAGFQFYNGAWRHENETWIFLKNACDCKSATGDVASACRECNEVIPGTNMMRIKSNCIEKNGISDSDCPYRLLGVSGGTVLYPAATTGVSPLLEGGGPGGARLCYMYSQITGKQIRNAEQVASSCRSTSAVNLAEGGTAAATGAGSSMLRGCGGNWWLGAVLASVGVLSAIAPL